VAFFFVVDGGINGEESKLMSGRGCVFAGVVGFSLGVRVPSISCRSVSYGEEKSANMGSFPPMVGARGVLCACASEGESGSDVSSRSPCEDVGRGGVDTVAPVTVDSSTVDSSYSCVSCVSSFAVVSSSLGAS
jgi:hypothetical protein